MMTRGTLIADGKKRKTSDKTTVHEERSTTQEEHGSMELLPDIPHDVTVQVIGTKLPWSTFRSLSSVSPAWQQAIQGRELFEARVRSHSTDKLVVLNQALSNKTYGIALYSLREKVCFQLPPIPHIKSGIPESCQCITLDGKIYILGGLKNSSRSTKLASEEVYMLDLAGQRNWKKCASMQEGRSNSGCCILRGKIYVCGGCSHRAPVLTSEAYDPKVDAWTTITPMELWRTGHEVGVVEGELMITFGGRIFYENFRELQGHFRNPAEWIYTVPSLSVDSEVYNPVTDKWSVAGDGSERLISGRYAMERVFEKLFMANGRLHAIDTSEIFVYDLDFYSRTHLHSISRRADSLRSHIGTFPPKAVLAVDDELLAVGLWADDAGKRPDVPSLVLLQCRGLGSKDEEIVWEKAQCPVSFEGVRSPFLRLLQL